MANRNSDSTVSILLGQGNGHFKKRDDFHSGSWSSSITVGDFNSDGKVDLAVANYSPGIVSVLIGNGDGSFQPYVEYATGASVTEAVAAGDFNGDGEVDLAAGTFYPDGISIFLNTGSPLN